jgi:hypothetical protein
MCDAQFNRVKIFSATMAKDREILGERVTEWIRTYNGQVLDTRIKQSSDAAFHCLSIILFCKDEIKTKRTNKKVNNGDNTITRTT